MNAVAALRPEVPFPPFVQLVGAEGRPRQVVAAEDALGHRGAPRRAVRRRYALALAAQLLRAVVSVGAHACGCAVRSLFKILIARLYRYLLIGTIIVPIILL